jgi:hypothetical protein
MVTLFEVLYGTTDYDAFLKAAVWAHYYTNPRQFLYVFSMAVLHLEDCRSIILPLLTRSRPTCFSPPTSPGKLREQWRLVVNEAKAHPGL